MNQTINNYEILPTSSFFNFSDILTIGTIIAAFITLYITIRNNNKTLKKTLEYETNKRKLLEFNEIAVSVKAVEYELKKIDKMLRMGMVRYQNRVSYFETKTLFDYTNSLSDAIFDMETQFDLKSYYKNIKEINCMINKDARSTLFRSLDELHSKRSYSDSKKGEETKGDDMDSNDVNDVLGRIFTITQEGKEIAGGELDVYLRGISRAKEALIAEIAKINTSDFN
ncbi:hypothetical protein BFR40_07285 [Brochothrix thermosphacta]|uniref:hypothetical protein n=1 Tax=Brochothrix thermosphacta TaxID=2756 RepID=UPI00083F8AC4|nr:hypothetical protein [Brochothrix thermosphacta]ODJ51793.1 hypothetical protein BFR40_07285 [Brochothrix thermosphacta]